MSRTSFAIQLQSYRVVESGWENADTFVMAMHKRIHKLACRNRNVYLVQWTYVTCASLASTINKLRTDYKFYMYTNTHLSRFTYCDSHFMKNKCALCVYLHFKNRQREKEHIPIRKNKPFSESFFFLLIWHFIRNISLKCELKSTLNLT